MERKIIENERNLYIIEVSKNDVVKRYEISAEDGYEIANSDGERVNTMIFPAKLGLENILDMITVTEK